MIDADRIEIEVGNSVDLLFLHLGRLERLSRESLSKEQKERLAKTANIFSSRTVGLANQAQRVMRSYPRLT